MTSRLTDAERAGLLIGSAGLFLIAQTSTVGVIVLAYQGKDIPGTLGGVAFATITAGIASLNKIGEDARKGTTTDG